MWKKAKSTIKEAHTESSQLVIFGTNVLMVLSVEITLRKKATLLHGNATSSTLIANILI